MITIPSFKVTFNSPGSYAHQLNDLIRADDQLPISQVRRQRCETVTCQRSWGLISLRTILPSPALFPANFTTSPASQRTYVALNKIFPKVPGHTPTFFFFLTASCAPETSKNTHSIAKSCQIPGQPSVPCKNSPTMTGDEFINSPGGARSQSDKPGKMPGFDTAAPMGVKWQRL